MRNRQKKQDSQQTESTLILHQKRNGHTSLKTLQISPYPGKISILFLGRDADHVKDLRNEWERKWMAKLNNWVPRRLKIY